MSTILRFHINDQVVVYCVRGDVFAGRLVECGEGVIELRDVDFVNPTDLLIKRECGTVVNPSTLRQEWAVIPIVQILCITG